MCPMKPELTTLPHNWQQTVPSWWDPDFLFFWHALIDKAGHPEQRKRKSRSHQWALKLEWDRREVLSGPDGKSVPTVKDRNSECNLPWKQ